MHTAQEGTFRQFHKPPGGGAPGVARGIVLRQRTWGEQWLSQRGVQRGIGSLGKGNHRFGRHSNAKI